MKEDRGIVIRDDLFERDEDLLDNDVDVESRGDDRGRLPQIFRFLAPLLFKFKQPTIFDSCGCMCCEHLEQQLFFVPISVGLVALCGDHSDHTVVDPHWYSHHGLDLPGAAEVQHLPLVDLCKVSQDDALTLLDHGCSQPFVCWRYDGGILLAHLYYISRDVFLS